MLHAVSEVQVRFERERIEVTRDGTLPPFKPDYMRKFIPGLTTVYATVDGIELPRMTPEEYAVWKQAAPKQDGEASEAAKGTVTSDSP